MRLKPSQLSQLLAACFKAREPSLITGKPGIGKTKIVEQACAIANANLILSHPVTADPTDAKGLPWMAEDHKSAQFLPFGDLYQAMTATSLTVWFLDDLGQAQPATQASFMQLLLAREINGHKIPDCVVFVAATNRRVDRAGVTGILEPVKSRFATIIELETDVDDWGTWALNQPNFKPELVAFIRFRPELLCQFTPTADLTNCPLPRTWEKANKILNMDLPAAIEGPALAGAVGEAAAIELQAFLTMYRQLPSIDGILLDPDAQDIPESPNVLFAVTTGLAMKANEQNFSRIARYAQRLLDAGHGEFAALLLRDITRRLPGLQQTPDFVKLVAGELGQLISGAV